MKYIHRDLGESAENSSGGGREGLIREILTLAILTVTSLVVLYLTAGWITDLVVSRITPQQEARLFASFMDPTLNEEVPDDLSEPWQRALQILDKLSEYSGVVELDYRLGYSSETRPNAYAVPGGLILLTHGLLENLDDDIAIAFVIAHELGHFAGRDHLKSMGRGVGFGLSLALLTGGSTDGLLDSTAQLMMMNYSRSAESAADRFAVACLTDIYGETDGAERLFELLDAKGKIPDWAYMFMTHPANAERIRNIHNEREK